MTGPSILIFNPNFHDSLQNMKTFWNTHTQFNLQKHTKKCNNHTNKSNPQQFATRNSNYAANSLYLKFRAQK